MDARLNLLANPDAAKSLKYIALREQGVLGLDAASRNAEPGEDRRRPQSRARSGTRMARPLRSEGRSYVSLWPLSTVRRLIAGWRD
jgi:hypothetical protein